MSANYTHFTGLRPVWDEFWSLEEIHGSTDQRQPKLTARNQIGSVVFSTSLTTKNSEQMIKFVTGSEWSGDFNSLGIWGMGIFKMPHGVIYEGTMIDSMFEGYGCLRYPNGGVLEGFWHEGMLTSDVYSFSDKLKWEPEIKWAYCKPPDRRFFSEIQRGLKPADTEQLSMDDPPFELPPGVYDVVDGLYSPKTKCVTDRYTGEVLRIPTVAQEQWILENCRVGIDTGKPGSSQFQPHLLQRQSEVTSIDNSEGYEASPDYYIDPLMRATKDALRPDGADVSSSVPRRIGSSNILDARVSLSSRYGSTEDSDKKNVADESEVENQYYKEVGVDSDNVSSSTMHEIIANGKCEAKLRFSDKSGEKFRFLTSDSSNGPSNNSMPSVNQFLSAEVLGDFSEKHFKRSSAVDKTEDKRTDKFENTNK